jgi:poly-gamma-glutamate synthesis protein (capsule biosynthesis protein)
MVIGQSSAHSAAMRAWGGGRTRTAAGLILFVGPVLLLVSACAAVGPVATLSEVPPPPAAAPRVLPPPAPPRSFTVVASGDVLLHGALWRQANQDAGGRGYDFGPMFASVRPVVTAADLAICHLETPLGEPNGPFSGYPIFNGPPQVATTLAEIGYDSCSTASNHSLDKGTTGVVRTLDVLDAAGLRHAGTARSQTEWASQTLLRVRGVVVGQLSYTFSFNGLRLPRDKPWLANPLDIDTILLDARRARIAGAEVVIVSLHFGTEYQHSPNGHQINVARRLLRSPDIDLILGHHAHVVQPIEKIGDKWVAYGLGNQVSNQVQAQNTRDGIMPRFTFTEVSAGVFKVTKAEVIPTHMWLNGPRRLLDIPAVLADPDTPASVRASCLASLRRTRSVVGQRGAYGDGLTLAGAERL